MNFKVPLRNVLLQRRRYYFLGAAIAFGFMVVTLFGGATAGLVESMKEKASRYFSGHVDVRSYRAAGLMATDMAPVEALLRASGLGLRSVARRTIVYEGTSNVYFGGGAVPQRRVVGVDFSAEGERFAAMPYAAGNASGMAAGGGILISQDCASALGATIGDDVTLLHQMAGGGAIDTATLRVRGIFKESSIFGYVAYASIGDVNALLGIEDAHATDLAVYLGDASGADAAAEGVRKALGARYRTFGPIASREDLDAQIAAGIGFDQIFAVLSVDAQMSQFSQLLGAIGIVTWAALGVFAAIVAVGISNSYRMIVNERMRELGTMRAMGMTKGGLRGMFVFEAFVVASAGAALGLAAGVGALAILGAFDLSWIPGSGLFLDDGRLRYAFDGPGALRAYAAMAAVAIFAAAGPAFRASRVPPVRALRGE